MKISVLVCALAAATSAFAGHVPVRTITAFIYVTPPNAESKLKDAVEFLKQSKSALQKRGYEVQTVRVATQAAAEYTAKLDDAEAAKLFNKLDAIAQREGVYVSIGPLDPARNKLNAEIFSHTSKIFANMILHDAAAARAAAELIMTLSRQIADGSQNFRFAAIAELAAGAPFLPGAYASKELDRSFALGAESTALFREDGDVEKELGDLAAAGESLVSSGWTYAGLDGSPAPAPGNSIAEAIEKISGQTLGSPGTLLATAGITARIKALKVKLVGFNGLMLPVLEDEVLAKRLADGTLSLYSLLLYSAVCGTGLDTLPIPGDVAVDRVAALLEEVALLASRWHKPLTARLFPVPGKKAGDEVRWKVEHLVEKFRVMPL